jgi:hypothetical protein
MLGLKKGQIPIFAINFISLIAYSVIFLLKKNYEFLIYIGVILFFLIVVLISNKKVNYPNGILWGLTIWSILHMSGGGLTIGGGRLYEFMIWDIVGPPYEIFKFDQFVHIIGFWVATLVSYHILKPSLVGKRRWISLSIILMMAGLGFGALNEIVEFFASVFLDRTGVGGYENTSLDLISNLIGASIAIIHIRYKEKKHRHKFKKQ